MAKKALIIKHEMASVKRAKPEVYSSKETYVQQKVSRSLPEIVSTILNDQRNIDALKAKAKKANKREAFKRMETATKAPAYMSDPEIKVLRDDTISKLNKISSKAKEVRENTAELLEQQKIDKIKSDVKAEMDAEITKVED